jgi:Glycosyltransferase family 87
VKYSALAVLAALMMAASTWFYFQRVLIRAQEADAVVHDHPRGNLSDLYPRWWGAHELLLHGRDPYSDPVTREIQLGYYGRVLDPSRHGDPKDQQGFAYPLYVVFLLAPTLHLPFPTAQRAFLVLLWVLTGVSIPLWLYALRWRPRREVTAILVILTLGSLPVVQGLKLQQLTLLVAGMLAGCAAAAAAGYFVLAGILLALATIKPQLTWLLVPWLLAWTARDWRRRQRLAWAFGATLLLLVGGAEAILPGWISRFRMAAENYQRYTHLSVLGFLLTRVGGEITAAALIIFAAWLCWPFLAEAEHSTCFGLSLALVLALTVVIVPMFAPYNQVLLLPALLLLLRHAGQLWQGTPATRVISGVTALLLFWPWIASIALTLRSFVLPAPPLQISWAPFFGSLMLPIAVFVLIALWAASVHSRGAPADSASDLSS